MVTKICIYAVHPHVMFILSLLLLRLQASLGDQVAIGVTHKCIAKEMHALLEFKANLQDPRGFLSTWKPEEDNCCKWNGVMCNKQTGHVTMLLLYQGNLGGEISPALFNLTYLTDLVLTNNSFHGTIPRFIGSMSQLRVLDLGLNYFNGTIPPEIGNLTNLEVLSLGCLRKCKIENMNWLSRLSHLDTLRMNGISLARANHWVNVILRLPKLSSLFLLDCDLSRVMYPYSSMLNFSSSSIVILNLANNNLTSSINHWLLPLTSNNLLLLDLSHNMIDVIPKYLGNLCSLREFHFFGNSAIIRLEDFLNNLSGCTSGSLQYLYAQSSQFIGRLSDEIQSFKSLESLNLSFNQLNETISEKLWQLPNLKKLDVSSNSLRGNISSNNISGEVSNLSLIDLSSNSFDGVIPVFRGLASLKLSRNKFYGGISFVCQMSKKLELLDLSRNALTGSLPDCFENFTELTVLNLGRNNLSGRLPRSLGNLVKLEVLCLYNNSLFGELPLSLKNCNKLSFLGVGDNMFFGKIPVWIGENLSLLYVLSLSSNNFFGNIPSQLCKLVNLQILDLSMNNLNGPIPSCLDNLTTMVEDGLSQYQKIHYYKKGIQALGERIFGHYIEYVDHATIKWQGNVREFKSINLGLLRSIDLSSNNLAGQIPFELVNLHQLIALNLSRNALQGEIPHKIGEMNKLLTLDLSSNNLSGLLPSSMSRMNLLNYLDVSYNNLSGRIPSCTQLQSFNRSRYTGNPGLCGPPLTKYCVGDDGLRVQPFIEENDEDIDELQRWFFIGGVTGFVVGFCIACSGLLLNRRGRFVLSLLVSLGKMVYFQDTRPHRILHRQMIQNISSSHSREYYKTIKECISSTFGMHY